VTVVSMSRAWSMVRQYGLARASPTGSCSARMRCPMAVASLLPCAESRRWLSQSVYEVMAESPREKSVAVCRKYTT